MGRVMSGPQSCSQLVGLDEVNATVAAADVVVLGLALQITNAEGLDRAHSEAALRCAVSPLSDGECGRRAMCYQGSSWR